MRDLVVEVCTWGIRHDVSFTVQWNSTGTRAIRWRPSKLPALQRHLRCDASRSLSVTQWRLALTRPLTPTVAIRVVGYSYKASCVRPVGLSRHL